MTKALRKYAGYAAFAAAALVVLVWMKMPSDALRSLVLSALSKNKADLLVRLETAELALPFGLTLTGLSVQPRDGRGPGLEAGTVTARAAVLPLMAGRLAFRVQATAMGGRVAQELRKLATLLAEADGVAESPVASGVRRLAFRLRAAARRP